MQKTPLNSDVLVNSEQTKLESFIVSEGRTSIFFNPQELRSVLLNDKTDRVVAANISKTMVTLHKKLKEFETLCIFNVEEPECFYKLKSRQFYLFRHEDCHFVSDIMAMKAKVRITSCICINSVSKVKSFSSSI